MLRTTKTIGRTRLLCANLLQPLKVIQNINARLDCLLIVTREVEERMRRKRAHREKIDLSYPLLICHIMMYWES
ncbi:hypothetical protein K1719_024581 [Acacia pycnantha]|nr:hypothetical protein K1719_024581 [Acacia pycnantha]